MSNASSVKPLRLARAGGICYVLWGLWHLRVVADLWQFAGTQAAPVTTRLEQGAFHILGFALCAIAVGLWLNWRNSRLGYWLNLLAIGWTEIGLFAIVMPSLPALPASIWVGPVLWALAVALTAAGRVAAVGGGTTDAKEVRHEPA